MDVTKILLNERYIVGLQDATTLRYSFTLSSFNIKKEPNSNNKNSNNHKHETPCQYVDRVIHYFSFSFACSDGNKHYYDLIQLGYPLLGKIGYLNSRADMITHHYGRLIELVEEVNKDTKELKQVINKNGNGHGLS